MHLHEDFGLKGVQRTVGNNPSENVHISTCRYRYMYAFKVLLVIRYMNRGKTLKSLLVLSIMSHVTYKQVGTSRYMYLTRVPTYMYVTL